MTKQVQKTRTKAAPPEKIAEPETATADRSKVALSDELLDEIDGLLEENAAEFVSAFVQQGGQ